MPTPVLLFDVNETLLDLSALNPLFRSAFGDSAVRQQWFLTLQSLWMTGMLTGRYRPFDELARVALRMTASRQRMELSAADESAILKGMKELPPHADVPAALALLRSSGLRLAALTNGTPASARAQLRYAELTPYFEQVLSADTVKRYKPAPEPYLYAASRLGVLPRSVDLVSVHAWDIAGARAAGLFTVFVERPGHPPNPSEPRADIVVSDLGELARNIAARRQSRRRR